MLEYERQVRKIGWLEVTKKLSTLLLARYNISTYSKHFLRISKFQFLYLALDLSLNTMAINTVTWPLYLSATKYVEFLTMYCNSLPLDFPNPHFFNVSSIFSAVLGM